MTLGVPHVPYFDATEDLDDYDGYDDLEEAAKLFAETNDEDDDFSVTDFEADDFSDDEDDDFRDFEDEEEESEEEWVELHSIFDDAGFLFIFDKIDGEAATNLISSILFLNEDDERIAQVSFFINSPGGFLKPGLAIFDIMQSCDVNLCLNTLGLGLVASTASLILSAGDLGCRWAFPHTRVMMHQPAGKFIPKPQPHEEEEKEKKRNSRNRRIRDLTSYTDELLDLRQKIIDVYAFTTANEPAVISRDIERDFFMSAEEAQAYGIIDYVTEDPEKEG